MRKWTVITLGVIAFLFAVAILSSGARAEQNVVLVRKPLTGSTYPCKELSRDKHYKYLACPLRRR